MNYKIAVITPLKKEDFLTNTILDGLIQLSQEYISIKFKISSRYPGPFQISPYYINKSEFISFADEADIIFFLWGKKNTDYRLANEINRWSKTVFIDGSEVGDNNRYDFTIQKKILDGTFKKTGRINPDMLEKCCCYFRREKPYIKGIIPLPFGIESRYIKYVHGNTEKSIDFVCIFGQDRYPLLRQYAAEILIRFCKKHDFSYRINKTDNQNAFYELLAKAKVGISVGGGGFDTARFWEILGNNCILLTENIDIYHKDSKELDYDNILQFNNLFDFEYKLQKLGNLLKTDYNNNIFVDTYNAILLKHGSKARVKEILNHAL